MKLARLLCCTFVLFFSGYLFAQNNRAGRIDELVGSCQAELEEALKVATVSYEAGETDFEVVIETQMRLLEFELDNARDAGKRQQILARQFSTAKSAEQLAREKFENGAHGALSVHLARSNRMMIEIALLREDERQ